MKKHIVLLTIVLSLVFFTNNVFAQANPPGSHGATGNQSGSPIGSELFIMLGLGIAYGGKKLYDWKENSNSSDE